VYKSKINGMDDVNEYRIISLGYEQVYGQKGMTLDEIREFLKDYDQRVLIELCTKLGIILFQTVGGLENFRNGQVNIVRSLYTDEDERKEFTALLNKAVKDTPAVSWGLYSKHSTMFLLKLALENCPAEGGKMPTQDFWSKISRVLMSLNDYLESKDSDFTKLIVPQDYSRAKIREFMFRRLKFTVHETFPYPLYRNLRIIKYLKKQQPDFDFEGYFKTATGLSLRTFSDICTMLSLKWVVKNKDFFKDENGWFIYKDQHFREVKISKTVLNKIYDLLVLKPDEYQEQYELSKNILKGNDDYEYNYLFLMKLPLIDFGNILSCPSPEYFISKVTEGPYRIVSDHLNKIGEEQKYKNMPSYWGKAYEKYANESLSNVFGSNYKNVAEGEFKRPDGIYEGKNTILLFETKSIHISYKATITGNADDLKNPFEQCFGPKHGVIQAVTFAKDIYEGKFELKSKLNGRKILPIVVTSDFIPTEPFHYAFFQKLLKQNGVELNKPYLLPFIYLSIEEVELLEAMATEKSTDEIEQILVDFSDKISQPNLENDFSFKNYLFSKGINIPLNKTIWNDFEKHTDRLKAEYFKHPQI
jgi:hypothetical protein